jgi:hypothetical protein
MSEPETVQRDQRLHKQRTNVAIAVAVITLLLGATFLLPTPPADSPVGQVAQVPGKVLDWATAPTGPPPVDQWEKCPVTLTNGRTVLDWPECRVHPRNVQYVLPFGPDGWTRAYMHPDPFTPIRLEFACSEGLNIEYLSTSFTLEKKAVAGLRNLRHRGARFQLDPMFMEQRSQCWVRVFAG